MFKKLKNMIYLLTSASSDLQNEIAEIKKIRQDHAKALYKLEDRSNRIFQNIADLERAMYGIKMDHNHLKIMRGEVQELQGAFETWQKNALVNHNDIEVISNYLVHNHKERKH